MKFLAEFLADPGDDGPPQPGGGSPPGPPPLEGGTPASPRDRAAPAPRGTTKRSPGVAGKASAPVPTKPTKPGSVSFVGTPSRPSNRRHAWGQPKLDRSVARPGPRPPCRVGPGPHEGRCTSPYGLDRDRPEGRPAGSGAGTASVTISGREYPYSFWDGRTLAGEVLGFDTETAEIEPDEVPPLALASASSGVEHCLIHPDRVGEFLRLHRDRHLVFHNVAFDFWTVAEHLAARGEAASLAAWWEIAEADRMHDTMLLDELIRLARTDAYPRARDLGVVALEYAGLELDKADPFRLRYGELIGRDWAAVERGFFDYAVKDPIATLAAYHVMRAEAIKLMEVHEYDPSRRP